MLKTKWLPSTLRFNFEQGEFRLEVLVENSVIVAENIP